MGPLTLAGLDALLQGLAAQPEGLLVAETDADAAGGALRHAPGKHGSSSERAFGTARAAGRAEELERCYLAGQGSVKPDRVGVLRRFARRTAG